MKYLRECRDRTGSDGDGAFDIKQNKKKRREEKIVV